MVASAMLRCWSGSLIGTKGAANRFEMVAGLARAHQRPISYCNLIGGNDQIIFDGNSFAVNSAGNVIAQLAAFREDERVVDKDSTSTIEFQEGKKKEQI